MYISNNAIINHLYNINKIGIFHTTKKGIYYLYSDDSISFLRTKSNFYKKYPANVFCHYHARNSLNGFTFLDNMKLYHKFQIKSCKERKICGDKIIKLTLYKVP
jgi:hypothetical protein